LRGQANFHYFKVKLLGVEPRQVRHIRTTLAVSIASSADWLPPMFPSYTRTAWWSTSRIRYRQDAVKPCHNDKARSCSHSAGSSSSLRLLFAL